MDRPHLDSFSRARQSLHWAITALILAMIPIGLIMARTLDDGLRLGLYQAHLVIGWTVVALVIARLVLKARRKVPPPPGLAPWNLRLHGTVQWTVAVFPLLLAVSGMGAILQNDLTPLLQAGVAPPATLDVTQARDGHMVGAYLFTALLVVHVAGVVRYQTTRGNVLARMGVGRDRG
ncbi:MAG: cytochrome b/b6 domain-containing protein [Trueperaceae bacterium]